MKERYCKVYNTLCFNVSRCLTRYQGQCFNCPHMKYMEVKKVRKIIECVTIFVFMAIMTMVFVYVGLCLAIGIKGGF